MYQSDFKLCGSNKRHGFEELTRKVEIIPPGHCSNPYGHIWYIGHHVMETLFMDTFGTTNSWLTRHKTFHDVWNWRHVHLH